MKKHDDFWYQGKVAVMDATEKMSYEDISKANAAAEKLVFSALSDKPVAACENSDDAKRIVACVNASAKPQVKRAVTARIAAASLGV